VTHVNEIMTHPSDPSGHLHSTTVAKNTSSDWTDSCTE